MKKGDFVSTPYGDGVISSYSETDAVYSVELPYATLYVPITEDTSLQRNRTMELNVAYEALDQMRRQNLEVECHCLGLQVNHNQCTMCLLTPRNHRMRFPRIQRYRANRKQAQGCLCCGSPVCGQHSCPLFRKEGIPVCVDCEQLFTLDFVLECMTAYPEKRREHVDHMMNVYDRVVLLYLYSMQFVDQVAENLQQRTRTHNHVSVTSSSVGMLSGVLGVAAAATILTPAGPPLLIASLLFGGSATAVQTGTEMRNYYSEPNQLADRILALHGIVHAILRTTRVLRDALMRDSLQRSFSEEDDTVQDTQHELLEDCSTVTTALTVGQHDGTSEEGMESESLSTMPDVGTKAGRKARFATRTAENVVTKTSALAGRHGIHTHLATATGIMRAATVARFAGGALSAASLLLETKYMANTIRQIKAGNPCEKADLLHRIKTMIEELPSTESLHGECMSYLEAMAQHEGCMTEEEALRLVMDASKLDDVSYEGTLTNDESEDNVPEEPPVPDMIESQGSDESEPPNDDSQKKTGSLILGHIKRHKKHCDKDMRATFDNPMQSPVRV